jgi:hypothetical protein
MARGGAGVNLRIRIEHVNLTFLNSELRIRFGFLEPAFFLGQHLNIPRIFSLNVSHFFWSGGAFI